MMCADDSLPIAGDLPWVSAVTLFPVIFAVDYDESGGDTSVEELLSKCFMFRFFMLLKVNKVF